MRMDVFQFPQITRINQRLQPFESRMVAQHMADHEDPPIVGGRLHRPLGIGNRQRDRFFDQHVLAGLGGADRHFGVKLRRQRHHDGVDITTLEQFVRRYRLTFMFGGKAFRAVAVGVRNGLQNPK